MPPQQTSCSSYQRDSLHYSLDVLPDKLLVRYIAYRYSYRQSCSSIYHPDQRSTVRGAKFYHYNTLILILRSIFYAFFGFSVATWCCFINHTMTGHTSIGHTLGPFGQAYGPNNRGCDQSPGYLCKMPYFNMKFYIK